MSFQVKTAATPGNSKAFETSILLIFAWATAVSYTHLRAHETPEHLVCRLLLEKKKKKKDNDATRCDETEEKKLNT